MSATEKQADQPVPVVVQVYGQVELAEAKLVVLRSAHHEPQKLRAVLNVLAGKVPKGTPVVVLPPGRAIELLSEAEMAKRGWVRSESKPAGPAEEKQ